MPTLDRAKGKFSTFFDEISFHGILMSSLKYEYYTEVLLKYWGAGHYI
jgi:hypothetical protein